MTDQLFFPPLVAFPFYNDITVCENSYHYFDEWRKKITLSISMKIRIFITLPETVI